MDKELINEVKKKREFSELPDSVVLRSLKKVLESHFPEKFRGRERELTSEAVVSCFKGSGLGDVLEELDLDKKGQKEIVKEVRADLRKYFGVFLTNKVLKPKVLEDFECVLRSHKSSSKRNYFDLYREIFGESLRGEKIAVFDFGAGANGFSYPYLLEVLEEPKYFAVEAAGQLVKNMNEYFSKAGFKNARAVMSDLFDLKNIEEVISGVDERKFIFLFQVVDALENLEKDSSKLFLKKLSAILDDKDFIVVSLPLKSLSGKKTFEVRRNWIKDFFEEEFEIVQEFEHSDEEFFVLTKK